jgi:hypothetical protein
MPRFVNSAQFADVILMVSAEGRRLRWAAEHCTRRSHSTALPNGLLAWPGSLAARQMPTRTQRAKATQDYTER